MPILTSGSLAASRDLTARLLAYIRSGEAATRVELADLTGMSRTNIADRVGELLSLGLITESGAAPSTGGRAPRRFRVNAAAAAVLAVELGMTSVDVAVTNLLGEPVVSESHDWGIGLGPEKTLALVEESARRLLRREPVAGLPLVGAGVGFPGPVQVNLGRPVSPPGTASWDGYPIAEHLAARFEVDVWLDNEANMVALGEFRGGAAQQSGDLILVKVGSGIGAGIITDGRLYRGALGGAGDIAHLPAFVDRPVPCYCGKESCLVTVASGTALARQAAALAADGGSAALARRAAGLDRPLTAADLAGAARDGDLSSVRALSQAGHHLGRALAMLAGVLNPALILLSGGVMNAADFVLPAVRRAVYGETTPLAGRELRVELSAPDGQFGLAGAALTAIDELFSAERLGTWPTVSAPAGAQRADAVG